MYISILSVLLLSPLLNFIALAFFGRRFGATYSKWHTYFILSILNICFFYFFYGYFIKEEIILQYNILAGWVNVGSLYLHYGLFLDSLSQVMCFLVIFVSTIVHIYAFYYMENDPNLIQFISYLSLFTFSMLLLLLTDNMLLFFSGWELVGLASFLLIGFWSTRNEARKAALKAVVLNRFGDCAFIGALALLFSLTKSNEFHVMFAVFPIFVEESPGLVYLILLLLFLASIAKSAQLFLHIWLLDAMEGPTPVSALLHAATMVTAGVYLIMRFSYMFELNGMGGYKNPYFSFMVIISSLTIVFGATAALVQNDLKKTIAYSTCSQIAYMFTAALFSGYSQALFHLFTHGFFKALLFLSAGLIIHNLSDEQDIRKMGGLLGVLPITYTYFLIGSCSIIGFPFLSGFYSKDAILELLYSSIYCVDGLSGSAMFAYSLANMGIYFTTFYSLRLLYLVFITKANGYKSSYKYNFSEEGPGLILLVLGLLGIGSIIFGYIFKDLIIGVGSSFLEFPLYASKGEWGNKVLIMESYALYNSIKAIPLWIIGLSGFSVYIIYKEEKNVTSGLMGIYRLFQTGYYINFIILWISLYSLKSFRTFFLIEKGLSERVLPQFFKGVFLKMSRNYNSLTIDLPYRNYIRISGLSLICVMILLLLI